MRARGRLSEALEWRADRLLIGDLVLRLQYQANSDWELGEQCLAFFKDRETIEVYDGIFAQRPTFEPKTVIELGIWDGGSVAFWYEYFEPELLLAFDLQERSDSAYFDAWRSRRGAGKRVQTHWRTDQADQLRIVSSLAEHDVQSIDLVIDDASHLYRQTLRSFEILLPFVRPGGLYVIEDWNWAHWPAHFGLGPVPLTRLVFDLVEALGTSSGAVSRIEVLPGLVVVERGPEALRTDGSFQLARRIRRQPALRRLAARLSRWRNGR